MTICKGLNNCCFLNLDWTDQEWYWFLYRSNHQSCPRQKGVLRSFTKFIGKHLCQSLFFNKVAGLRPATLLKKKLWHRCFAVNSMKLLRTPYLQSTPGGLFYLYSQLPKIISKRELGSQQKKHWRWEN